MPADLTEFQELSQSRRGPRCGVYAATLVLEGEDLQAFQAALETDPALITSAGISAWLERRSHRLAAQAIARHRNGKCACDD